MSLAMEGCFDGGSRGNPGCAGAGWVLWSTDGPRRQRVDAGTVFVGDNETNNVSEYTGAIELAEAALRHGARSLVIRGDSKLVVMQVTGKWKANAPHLIPLRDRLQELRGRFPDGCSLFHIPRAMNKAADGLSNLAMDDRHSYTGLHLLDRLADDARAPPPPVRQSSGPDQGSLRAYPPKNDVARITSRVRIRRRRDGTIIQDCDRYVGRRVTYGGWDLPDDDFRNPISAKSVGSAQEAVRRYMGYLCGTRRDLLERILAGELRGKRLGCFCEPDQPSHADILAELSDDPERVRAILQQLSSETHEPL